ncbi:metalloregulator ArsR/SmtB family transcription factor [Streptomyces sp. NBC_01408]|uniref:helix-turn-helix transcriptional regulator n=1 Tax=Streptomyces sp. NBC_01408 TaxID=2903855 RepID=UPI0022581F48|nr:helix-turn-helix domain-containing protein [Streptomyces sp. NBC_01408]MCX4695450.1 helix-turn-helix domain-containing protein [Streptomyces sp. NBC_01408]
MDPAKEAHDVSALAALAEPTRRRLYEHVMRQAEPVSREQAASALGLARQTAAFHLDRLAEASLLDVVYERRSGRTGPGAGRPAKLYRRPDREITVSVPARRYELAAELLAQAVQDSEATGEAVRAVLHRKAHDMGKEMGKEMGGKGGVDLTGLLESCGFEPRREGTSVALLNCPFHSLARRHTDTVCGMNLHLLRGVLTGMGDSTYTARLAPAQGRCCVRLEAAG